MSDFFFVIKNSEMPMEQQLKYFKYDLSFSLASYKIGHNLYWKLLAEAL